MRTPLVIGNWKMHGSLSANTPLVKEMIAALPTLETTEIGLCPPFVYLHSVCQQLADTPIKLGAQNLCTEQTGAFTGEVSGTMLKDLNCTYVLIGHSERRALYGETDEIVAMKFASAQATGLMPVLCIGETLADRQAGNTLTVVSQQLQTVIDRVGINAFRQAVIAYEPVWAIGTGETATPEQAQEVHKAIRAQLATLDDEVGQTTRILYGGSVKPNNANTLFCQADIDGGLIGGASLSAESFIAICKAAASV